MLSMFDVPTKPGKKQLNLWLSEGTINALERVAKSNHWRGRTQAAEIIIEMYLSSKGQLKEPFRATKSDLDLVDAEVVEGVKPRKSKQGNAA